MGLDHVHCLISLGFAVPVSESNLKWVKEYIRNQEEHHKEKTFQEENEEFMRLYVPITKPKQTQQ